ncbi:MULTISPECIES: terminase large subunit domain-containing protein [unclassified Archaeoglobus]|jgi:phage FluMu gp28-like protein|uniref:terminase large subunit domain-containing protein n=1 Tax=unclassified Archaeoglobus TaxID=2643606 RepID=UPI0025BD255C|nr:MULTISPECIES: terminase family protein [unclassified Archaeoglobus]
MSKLDDLISELGKDKKKIKQAIRDPVLFTQIFLNHEPHEAQKLILRDKHQFITVVAGRRFGKTKAMAFSAIHYAITHPGSIQFILAPSYNQANIMFWEITTLLSKSILVHLIERVYKTPFSKIIFRNGSEIHARSTTKPEYLRGHKAHRAILDEAAYIPDDVISQVVEPMLADFNGSWIKIGTPFGKNHFYDSYLKGQSEEFEDYSSYRFPSTANPHISHEFIEKKKREYGENSIIFRTEYLAEFVEDQNAVFRWADIQRNISNIELVDMGQPGRIYAIGCDLAKYLDYTVIIVLDITNKPFKLVHFQRFNRRPYAETILKLKELYKRFNYAKVLIDSSGVGDPVLEDLQDIGAEGYVFTAKSKVQLIQRLQAAIENGEVKYPYIEELIKELQFFEYQLTRQGIKMEARQGMHDDCVIALALAVWAAGHGGRSLRRVYGVVG